MTSTFKTAIAIEDDWAHAAKACVDALLPLPEGACLGFVYATDALAEDLGSILTYLRQKTGLAHWTGTLGRGIHANGTEIFDRPALAVMIADWPGDVCQPFSSIATESLDFSTAVQSWISDHQPTFALVHGDPTNADIPAILTAMDEELDLYLVGGLTSSRQAHYSIADTVTGGGLSGVLFAPEVAVMTGLSQGCAPLAGSHVISDCLDNVVVGLDGRPALEVLKEDVGELLSRDLARLAGYVQVALPVEGSDTGDYLVRNLLAVDPARGWIGVGDTVQPGDRIMFVRRDPQSARSDLLKALQKMQQRLSGPPRGAIYVSCLARGPHMFGELGAESALIREVLGDIPMIGFFANGEISHNRLYGYTGVMTLFL
ncbi:hypothetical protein JCM17960_12040 [Magnetospira thiophila]